MAREVWRAAVHRVAKSWTRGLSFPSLVVTKLWDYKTHSACVVAQ